MKKLRNLLAIAIAIVSVSLVSVNAQTITGTKQGKVRTLGQQVNYKLLGLPNYGIFDSIKYEINGNTVTLTGKVYSLGTIRTATAVVKDVPGIVNVINNIQELPPSPFDNEIRRDALRTFSNNGLGGYFWETRPDVRIIVENGKLTLEGYVMNSGDYNSLNIYANGISGVFHVQNNLTVGRDPNR